MLIDEEFVPLMTTQGVHGELAIDDFASAKSGVDLGGGCRLIGRAFPFARESERATSQVVIRAHERAPEITSQIDLRGKGLGRAEIAAQNVEIEEAVIVEVSKLSAPRPTSLSDRDGGFLQA